MRQFCWVYLNRVPNDTTLIQTANLIQTETLARFNARITKLALNSNVTKGKKLRIDGTVVKTHIQALRDSRQLADSVRVLARAIGKARKVLQDVKEGMTETETVVDFTMAARRTARKIVKILRKLTDEAKETGKQQYQALLDMTEKTIQEAVPTSQQPEQQTSKATHA